MHPVDVMEEFRKKKRYTKTHIAKHCGHSVAWYADIAKKRRRLTIDDMLRIAEAIEEDPRNFFVSKLSVSHNSDQEVI